VPSQTGLMVKGFVSLVWCLRFRIFIHCLIAEESHPHIRCDSSIVSVPHVNPGDMVFWHCGTLLGSRYYGTWNNLIFHNLRLDVIHSVEQYHHGSGDSSVMYIPAVPLTPQNVDYLARHRDSFLVGMAPPDFPQGEGEAGFQRKGLPEDIAGIGGRRSMGFETFPERSDVSAGTREAIRVANAVLKGIQVWSWIANSVV